MLKKLPLILLFLGLFVVVSCSSVTTFSALHDDDTRSTEHAIQPADSVLPANDVQRRLEDPDFDIRFERGVMQPWHDRKSIYPRRTIPLSHLAMICHSDHL